jgi:hypothetical protein
MPRRSISKRRAEETVEGRTRSRRPWRRVRHNPA